MPYLLVTVVELSSETSHSAFNSTADGRAMLHRPEIDDDGAEILPLGHFSASGTASAGPMSPGEIGAVRRDRYQSE